jgi:glycosyltransferase involved in cell wall biosynthesis
MSRTSGTSRLRILFVCDFNSIHSRTYVDYFARRPEEFEIVILSSKAAAPMDGVTLRALQGSAVSSSLRTGRLGPMAYRASLLFPFLYNRVRGREDLVHIERNRAAILGATSDLHPEIIHAFRTLPEGGLGEMLKRHFPDVPFFLSTWGQDFVTWPRLHPGIDDATRAVVRAADWLLPDNPRDGRLARESFGLPAGAGVRVTTVPGGLDLDTLSSVLTGLPPVLAGSPKLLSMRGYENLYVKLRVQFEALALLKRDHPNVMLYVIGPANHPGRAVAVRWCRQLKLEKHVMFASPERGALLQYMRACDLYVSSTTSDGMPMSLLEALFFGLISVVADHESTSDVAREARGIVTFSTLEGRTLANAWRRGLEMLPHRPERIAHNRALLEREYARDSNLAVVSRIYREAAGGRR